MRLGSLVLGAALASCAGAFIVPDQLVSLLTVVYSVIPPIKKGSDSRVGFGYRFGPFADFQVLLELGPQSETQPIGGQTTPSSKRQVEPSDEDPGRRPDIQLLDGPEQVLDVPDPAPPSNSRSARSGPGGRQGVRRPLLQAPDADQDCPPARRLWLRLPAAAQDRADGDPVGGHAPPAQPVLGRPAGLRPRWRPWLRPAWRGSWRVGLGTWSSPQSSHGGGWSFLTW